MSKDAELWLGEYANLIKNNEATCPKCGSHELNYGYESKNNKSGFGAVWCEDCRSAFILSRVILTNETARQKIVAALPEDLKFV